jgi:endonuclease/exonuclease/phosphatase family metal-dependent hydrolase
MPSTPAVKTKKSRTDKIVLILNLGAITALLLSYAAAHFSPETMGYFVLFGLAYPFALLLNIAFIIYWLLKRPRFSIFSAVIILLGIGHLTDFFQISFSKSRNESASHLKVLTYNVHVFDVFDRKEGQQTRDAIFDILVREDADVLCFQEFFHSEKKKFFPTKDTLLTFLPNIHYHERYTHALGGQQYFGVALFSKYPIVRKGYVPFASDANNFCIYTDLLVSGDTIRVYNGHLQSIRLKPEDYDLANGKTEQSEIDDAGKRIARRLKSAFVKRQEQVDRIATSIQASPYPVVLCGDFNDPPVSYTYETLSDILEDSFVACGNGIGNTYIGAFPSFRIDYILHSPSLKTIAYKTLEEKLSDHHAITATLEWQKAAKQ